MLHSPGTSRVWRSHARSATTSAPQRRWGTWESSRSRTTILRGQSSCSRRALRSASPPVSTTYWPSRARRSAPRCSNWAIRALRATHLLHALTMHQELEDLLGIAVTLEELAAFAAAVGDGESRRSAARGGDCHPRPGRGAGRRGRRRQACADRVHCSRSRSARSGTTSRIATVSPRSPMWRSRPLLQAVGGSLPQLVEARP